MHPVALKHVRFQLPGAAAVVVRRGLEYGPSAGDGNPRVLNVYLPPSPSVPPPVVLFVFGRPDPGARTLLGCALSEMTSYDEWARLVAATGLTGVTYTTGHDPLADAHAVVACLRDRAGEFGVDPSRIGLWACSGNMPVALALLGSGVSGIACAALLYGVMDDVDIPASTPLLVIRAGQDAVEGVNASIDAFVAGALRRNLTMTVVNHPTAPHAFDLDDDGDATRAIVRAILDFLRRHLAMPRG
jgi:hypothetical protein